MTAIVIGGAAIALAVLFVIPRRYLPAVAIALLILLPIGYMDVSRIVGRYFTPSVLVLAVWAIRSFWKSGRISKIRLSPLAFIATALIVSWLAVSVLASSSSRLSLAWLGSAGVSVVVPYLLGRVRTEDIWSPVRTVLLAAGIFLGALSLIELFTGINPWDSLYNSTVLDKDWSIFRSRASLGHPLVLSLVATVIAMVGFFSREAKTVLRILGVVGAVISVALSVSRTGLIALAAGLLVGLIALLRSSAVWGDKRAKGAVLLLLIIGGSVTAGILASPLMSARNESSGGRGSAEYRQEGIGQALELISDNLLFGTGPGTGATVYSQVFDGPLENSGIQLVLSTGVVAGLGLALTTVVLIWRLIVGGQGSIASALTVVTIGFLGFNALDNNVGLLVIVAPLLYIAGNCDSRALSEKKTRKRLMAE